jgi:hypothetical protein
MIDPQFYNKSRQELEQHYQKYTDDLNRLYDLPNNQTTQLLRTALTHAIDDIRYMLENPTDREGNT